MLVKWSLVPGVNSGTVEVNDQATDAEIEEEIRKEVAQHISWDKQGKCSDDSLKPIACLNALKRAYYMVHMMAYSFNRWMEAVETTQSQQAIVYHMLKHWKREARFALKTVYPNLLSALQSSEGKELLDVRAVVNKTTEYTEALLFHLPKAIIKWTRDVEEKQNIAFYQACGYGDWYEAKLPELVEILFRRFCQLVGAHTKTGHIPETSYGIALHNLSDAMIIVPELAEAKAILEQYDCSPYSLMAFRHGEWISV